MKKLWGCELSILMMMTFGVTASAAGLHSGKATSETVPGEYLVRLTASGRGIAKSSAYVRSKIHRLGILVVQRPTFESEESALRVLRADPNILSAEPNRFFRLNDDFLPDLSKLWQFKTQTPAASDLQIRDAWGISTGSSDVIVAILDTGIDYRHPDLKDNMWTNDLELNGEPGVDDDENGYIDDVYGYDFVKNSGDPMDDGGHGSHCAGSIGATGNAGTGMIGVNRKVRMMALKFMDKSGVGSTENAIRAIDYAILMGARILSNSWGGVSEKSEMLKEAIERSHKAGALFVVAAGNIHNDNDKNKQYPACFNVPNILTVASVDKKGRLAQTSSYGLKSVELAAPGVDIYSTSLKNTYELRSGTSMAAPFVSGVAALILAVRPNISNLTLKRCLMNSVTPLDSLAGFIKTGGTLNAFGALTDSCKIPK